MLATDVKSHLFGVGILVKRFHMSIYRVFNAAAELEVFFRVALEFLQVVGWRGYCHRSVNQSRMLLPSMENDYSLDPPCSAMPSAPMPTGGIQVRLLT